jgi:hypothetical protein
MYVVLLLAPLVAPSAALRASGGVSNGRVHAAALRRRTVEADATAASKWAPGGPEHPRLP